MCCANGGARGGRGSFDCTPRQVIKGARKSACSLDEHFERLLLKGISMDADGPKPRSYIITRLSRLEPAKGQSEAQSRDQGAIDTQLQPGQQGIVIDQKQIEG